MQYKVEIIPSIIFCFLTLALLGNTHILFALVWFHIAHKYTKMLSGLAVEHLFKMAATDAEFWASLETNFSG